MKAESLHEVMKEGHSTAPLSADKKDLKNKNLEKEGVEHLTSLCQELTATILEQHSKTMKHYGAVKMSFEFPGSGVDTVVLSIHDDILTIGRDARKQRPKPRLSPI